MVHYLNISQVHVVSMALQVESVWLSSPEDEEVILFAVDLDKREMRNNTSWLMKYETFDAQYILFVQSVG